MNINCLTDTGLGTAEDEFSRVVIDNTMWHAGDTIKGLALLQSYKLHGVKQQKPYVTITLIGKYKRMIYCKYELHINNYKDAELKLLHLLGKVIFVDGSVDYMSPHILNLYSIQKLDTGLKPSDFLNQFGFDNNEDLDNTYKQVHDRIWNNSNLDKCLNALELIDFKHIFKINIFDRNLEIPETGAAYFIFVNTLRDISDTLTAGVEYPLYSAYVILGFYFKQYIEENKETCKIPSKLIYNIFEGIIHLFPAKLMSEYEIIHILEVLHIGAEPQTYLAKRLSSAVNYYTSVINDMESEIYY